MKSLKDQVQEVKEIGKDPNHPMMKKITDSTTMVGSTASTSKAAAKAAMESRWAAHGAQMTKALNMYGYRRTAMTAQEKIHQVLKNRKDFNDSFPPLKKIIPK